MQGLRRESSILCQTHTKSEFLLSSFSSIQNHFKRNVHPTLIIQELQTIKCIKQHITTIKFIKLATWWLPQTSDTHIRESRSFETMYTLQGKPDQYTTHIPRLVREWSHTIRISHGQCIATFHEVINRFVQIHCPWEEGLLTQSTARQSSDPRVRTQLLSHNSQWGSGEKTSFCWQPATRLTRPITLACDRYVQYLLTGVNPSVLNQHRRGL
jgi:hypothetical protein